MVIIMITILAVTTFSAVTMIYIVFESYAYILPSNHFWIEKVFNVPI